MQILHKLILSCHSKMHSLTFFDERRFISEHSNSTRVLKVIYQKTNFMEWMTFQFEKKFDKNLNRIIKFLNISINIESKRSGLSFSFMIFIIFEQKTYS